MNANIQNRIEKVRLALQTDSDGILTGWVNPPLEEVPESLQGFSELAEFFQVANGACCGEVVLFEGERLTENQFIGESLPGGCSRWLWFGIASNSPIIFDCETQLVSEADPNGASELLRCFGTVDEFLLGLFSTKYLVVAGLECSRWYDLLDSLELT